MLRRLCQIVLLVCLVLNGIGGASASVAMHRGSTPGDAVTVAADAATHAQPHAHAGASGQGGALHDTGAAHAAHAERLAATDPCDSGCCSDPDGCACLCLHHAHALVPPESAIQDRSVAGQEAILRSPRRPSPLPGQDIRPPIG